MMTDTVHHTHSYGQCRLVHSDDMSELSTFREGPDSFHRKCKIVCTMGPSCWDSDTLVKLIDAGMNIARLNFSHGDHKIYAGVVQRLREAFQRRPDKQVAILLDTKGPEIRTGLFREDVGPKIELQKGQELKLVTDYSFRGDSACLAVSYKKLPAAVQPGGLILCADGSLSLEVKSCGEDHVITQVLNTCKIGERKNVNLPGVKVDLPILQEKDMDDLLDFGIPHGIDFVAASFTQSANDVKLVREALGSRGRGIKIIAKIENEEGLKNFGDILAESDGIMVARGDLGMEIPTHKVFLAQKMMIARCNLKGKPVITATQMLESMVNSPVPTRAEASDVANAVLDGTDCVMLSGETAAGNFPENAVTIMRRICEEAESVIDYASLYLSIRLGVLNLECSMSSVESICSSAVKAAMDADCPLIVALTETGLTAQMIAKYRPKAPILAITASDTTVRQLLCVRGVVPVLTGAFVGTDSLIEKALSRAKDDGMVQIGDCVVAVHGQREECTISHSSLMKMVIVV